MPTGGMMSDYIGDLQIEYDQVCHELRQLPDLSACSAISTFTIDEISLLWASLDFLDYPDGLPLPATQSNQVRYAHIARKAVCSAIAGGELTFVAGWEWRVDGYGNEYPIKIEFPDLPDMSTIDTRKTTVSLRPFIQWAKKINFPAYKQKLITKKKDILDLDPRFANTPVLKSPHQTGTSVLMLPSYTTPALELLKEHVTENLAGLPEDQQPTPAEQKEWLKNQGERKGLGRREYEAIYTVARPECVKARATGKGVHPESE